MPVFACSVVFVFACSLFACWLLACSLLTVGACVVLAGPVASAGAARTETGSRAADMVFNMGVSSLNGDREGAGRVGRAHRSCWRHYVSRAEPILKRNDGLRSSA